jgi:shikimate kinase
MIFYLTGYMGSGKSRYGREAARRLGFGFIDLDEVIEEYAGKSINKIFADEGEDSFRSLERMMLMQTLPEADTIIATGGGTPCTEENLTFMKAHGKVVYLQLSAGVLASRLKILAPTLPVLSPYLDDLPGFVARHLAEREPWYLQADLIVSGEGLTGRKLGELMING